jgi:hypothetical protein
VQLTFHIHLWSFTKFHCLWADWHGNSCYYGTILLNNLFLLNFIIRWTQKQIPGRESI